MILILIKNELKAFLNNFEKVAILGIGNELREDDNVGPYILKKLDDYFKKNKLDQDSVILINAGSAPENFTGLLKREKPSHLIIIDAVLMNNDPGCIELIKKENIANVSLSTHSLSINLLINYLEKFISFDLLFIGIQPLQMSIGEDLSKEVKKSAEKLVSTLLSNLLHNS